MKGTCERCKKLFVVLVCKHPISGRKLNSTMYIFESLDVVRDDVQVHNRSNPNTRTLPLITDISSMPKLSRLLTIGIPVDTAWVSCKNCKGLGYKSVFQTQHLVDSSETVRASRSCRVTPGLCIIFFFRRQTLGEVRNRVFYSVIDLS